MTYPIFCLKKASLVASKIRLKALSQVFSTTSYLAPKMKSNIFEIL